MIIHCGNFTLESVVNSVRKLHLATFPFPWKGRLGGQPETCKPINIIHVAGGSKTQAFPSQGELAFGTSTLGYFSTQAHLYNEKQLP